MLRDKSLIPLSHQHQRALALCVRIERARPIPKADLGAWQEEIQRLREQEIEVHLCAEEIILFPIAQKFTELAPLVEELLSEHAELRDAFSQAELRQMSAESLSAFGQVLTAHIRKEERLLFEGLQRLMSRSELSALGANLEAGLKDAERSCTMPSEKTKLHPKA